MIARYFLLLAVLVSMTPVSADVPAAQRAEVEHLLAFVRNSECIFIRNGDEHAAADAHDHIVRKYEHFADEIDSTEGFIELAASRSTFSGKAYAVRCGETRLSSRDWLLQELARFRKAGGGKQ